MPEGHTLHRLAGELTTTFGGRVVRASSPQGRFAASAAQIDRQELVGAEAWGKHLFVAFPGDRFVHVHLGLYGTFDVVPRADAVPDPVGQVRMRLTTTSDGHASYADLRGATACELLTLAERDAIVARSGPDPLRDDADPDAAWQRIRRSRAPIGGLLMDQSVLAGVGNVYRAEVLFRHRIDPYRPGNTLRVGQWRAMWADLVGLMRRASGPAASTRCDPSTRPRRWDGRRAVTTTEERSTSTGARASRATSAAAPSGRRSSKDATSSGAANVSAGTGPGHYSERTPDEDGLHDRSE